MELAGQARRPGPASQNDPVDWQFISGGENQPIDPSDVGDKSSRLRLLEDASTGDERFYDSTGELKRVLDQEPLGQECSAVDRFAQVRLELTQLLALQATRLEAELTDFAQVIIIV